MIKVVNLFDQLAKTTRQTKQVFGTIMMLVSSYHHNVRLGSMNRYAVRRSGALGGGEAGRQSKRHIVRPYHCQSSSTGSTSGSNSSSCCCSAAVIAPLPPLPRVRLSVRFPDCATVIVTFPFLLDGKQLFLRPSGCSAVRSRPRGRSRGLGPQHLPPHNLRNIVDSVVFAKKLPPFEVPSRGPLIFQTVRSKL